MKKPKFLYHGSSRKIEGKLIPRKATDLGERPENMHTAVYATSLRKLAIAMAFCKSAKMSSMDLSGKSKGIIYEGWPIKQKEVFLYTLPSKTFKISGGTQWISLKPVKPIKVKKIQVKNFIYLIRKATKKERHEFLQKFGHKIPKK